MPNDAFPLSPNLTFEKPNSPIPGHPKVKVLDNTLLASLSHIQIPIMFKFSRHSKRVSSDGL
jgi:hypothetical protein